MEEDETAVEFDPSHATDETRRGADVLVDSAIKAAQVSALSDVQQMRSGYLPVAKWDGTAPRNVFVSRSRAE